MSEFVLYNTLTRSKDKFESIKEKKVSMYVCGITPYDAPHLGHARCYIVFDILKRFMEYIGYEVSYVQNITDIDDKIINKSKESGLDPADIAVNYFDIFQGAMKKLNVKPADHYPKVSETIADIITFVQALVEQDSAYQDGGDVYFRVSSAKDYGKLSGRSSEELVSRQDTEISNKEDIRDFALWKKDEEFGWNSPWGKGRPGWHIECSAMSKKIFGEQFDIHGGGLDLIFPHHENEIVQTEALTQKDPAKYWIHNGMVTLKGDKMSKSTGNFFLLEELLDAYSPMTLRMYLLMTSYRQRLDFSIDALKDADKAMGKLHELKKETKGIKHSQLPENNEIVESMLNDMNTAMAIGAVYKEITPLLERIYDGNATDDDLKYGASIVSFIEDVLGIVLDEDDADSQEIENLISERNSYRKEKNFQEADRVRDQLADMGVLIKDTPSGTKWVRGEQ